MKVIFECESLKIDYNADIGSVVSRKTYTFPFLENERWLPSVGEFITVDKLQYKIKEKKTNFITEDAGLDIHIDTVVFRATREV